MKTCKVKVVRDSYTTRSTTGKLFINDKFFCYTLEDTVRPDGVKVKKETAIQAGEYRLIVNKSNRFKRDMPLVLNVPQFTGIRIHGGNRHGDSEGCILVAYNYIDADTIQGTAEKDITGLLKGFDYIHLEIVNLPQNK